MANQKMTLSMLTIFGFLCNLPYIQTVANVVFAHMVNTPAAVRWGLNQGANAVEMDLRFNGNTPSYFQHSIGLEPCDCSCVCAIGSSCPAESVCKALWTETGSHCKASTPAENMTISLGNADIRDKLAIIYIDSKLSNSMVYYSTAGANVVKMLNRNVFARGYRGRVIINGASTIYSDYLKGALKEASSSPYANKYLYTFDYENNDYQKVWTELQRLGTDRIVYSTGISICWNTLYDDSIRQSAAKNVYAGIGIWTLDSSASMQTYLNAGVTSIMTNKPSIAVGVVGYRNMAAPGSALVAKVVPRAPQSYFQCDCNYHSGGCTISKSAPTNYACKCEYKGAWTCGGKTIHCSDRNAYYCLYPDGSVQACLFGGGDCKGY